MINVALAETYVETKRTEYIDFIEHFGESVRFEEDKWVCDKLRRAPSEGKYDFTLYFTNIPEKYREIAKFFSALRIVAGTTIGTVSVDVCNLKNSLIFGTLNTVTLNCICAMSLLQVCSINILKATGTWQKPQSAEFGRLLACFSKQWTDRMAIPLKTLSQPYRHIVTRKESLTTCISLKAWLHNWILFLKKIR